MSDALQITIVHRVEFSPETLAALAALPKPAVDAIASIFASYSSEPVEIVEERCDVSSRAPGGQAPRESDAVDTARVAPSAAGDGSGRQPVGEFPETRSKRWTPERVALLKQQYPAGVPVKDILRALNELPGEPIDSTARINSRVSKSDLRRPPGFNSYGAYATPVAQQILVPPNGRWAGKPRILAVPQTPSPVATVDELVGKEQQPATKPAPAEPPPKQSAPPRIPAPEILTPARRPILDAMYEDGEAVEHIVGALNELPGPRVNGAEIVAWVGMLGLRRGPRFFERMNAATSVRLTEALSPPPARPAPAPAPRRPDTAPLPAFRLPSSTSAPTATRRFVNDTPPETVIPQVMSAPDTHVVDWPYALQWAREKGVRIPDGSSRATTRLLINDERLKRRLPQWTIVEAKKTGPVPPPALTVVSGAENAT